MNSSIPTFSQANDVEATVCTIAAMRNQENTAYLRTDTLSDELHSFALDVDSDCRQKMVAWSYQVVDFCKFNRESVEISISYLDRFLACPQGVAALQDRSFFQLVAMASLYTAVKIHEPEAMDPKLVSSLSRGSYSPDDIEQMECCLAATLDWRLNPPTSLSFVREYLKLIPAEALSEERRVLAYDVATFQTELAVSDYEFSSTRASEIAYCSLLNALQSLNVDPKITSYVSQILQNAANINGSAETITHAQQYLHSAIIQTPLAVKDKCATAEASKIQKESTAFSSTSSPRTAMQEC